jgi:hypothetical protein
LEVEADMRSSIPRRAPIGGCRFRSDIQRLFRRTHPRLVTSLDPFANAVRW